MTIFRYLLVIYMLAVPVSAQQDISRLMGGWAGDLPSTDVFHFVLELKTIPTTTPELTIRGRSNYNDVALSRMGAGRYRGQLQNQVRIDIIFEDEKPGGFLQAGHHLWYLNFKPASRNAWTADWQLFPADTFDPTIYLSMDRLENGAIAASTFFQAPQAHYMYAQGFRQTASGFTFRDIRSNIEFEGVPAGGNIKLTLTFLGERVTPLLEPQPHNTWQIGTADPEFRVATPSPPTRDSRFAALTNAVLSDTLEGTHAILIWRRGKMLLEQYFDGFTADVPHDTRSLSKSLASAVVGLAIASGHLENEHQPVKPFFDDLWPEIDWGAGKNEITLFHLLTMSSGLDAIDFGLNRTSYANEGAYQSQDNWIRHILSAPMVSKPGAEANYGSGNPALLGGVLSTILGEDLAGFIHRRLFAPLGITRYRLQTDNRTTPYFGGGWFMTPRDLLKFGRLYLQEGVWEGRRVLPASWVRKSMQNHTVLANTVDKNGYGYLFWHKTYPVHGEQIRSVEARGSGGQYLFIVPRLQAVAVITSGNYRNGKGFQPERIMRDYILPQLVNPQ